MYLVALHWVITQLGLFLFLQKYAFIIFAVLQCAAVRPVVVCGGLRFSDLPPYQCICSLFMACPV